MIWLFLLYALFIAWFTNYIGSLIEPGPPAYHSVIMFFVYLIAVPYLVIKAIFKK